MENRIQSACLAIILAESYEVIWNLGGKINQMDDMFVLSLCKVL